MIIRKMVNVNYKVEKVCKGSISPLEGKYISYVSLFERFILPLCNIRRLFFMTTIITMIF